MKPSTSFLFYLFTVFVASTNLQASEKTPPPSLVDMQGFVSLSQEAAEYRKTRMLSLDDFIKAQQQSGVIILDSRSKRQFDSKHIKGAIHLNFSDFTQDKLAKIIPSKKTKILIYCNNNIKGDPLVFPTKSLSLALNIPTFINLYGYGYKNIYELADLVDIDDPKLVLAGKDVMH